MRDTIRVIGNGLNSTNNPTIPDLPTDSSLPVSYDKPVQVADKFYCPKDQLLLRFKAQINAFFCTDCGTLYKKDPPSSTSTTPATYSNREGSERSDPSLIDMHLVPLGRPAIEDEFSSEPATRHMQKQGWVLQESHTEAREEGTFSVNEYNKQKSKLTTTGNKNNYSVY